MRQPKHAIFFGLCVTAAVFVLLLSVSFVFAQPRPKSPVEKKDFASELAEFLNLPAAANKRCYADLKRVASKEAGAICALKKAKIFKGSSAEKFHPEAAVRAEFAILTLCRGEHWIAKPNFASCLAAGVRSGRLSKDFSTRIRRNRSQKLFERDLQDLFKKKSSQSSVTPPGVVIKDSGETETSSRSTTEQALPPSIPAPRNRPNPTFSPVAEIEIPVDFFEGVELTATIPTRFYLDEVYFLEGRITGEPKEEVFVFLCYEKSTCDDSKDFVQPTTEGGKRFRVPIFFRETGNFQIGVILGRAGQSRVETISVLAEPPTPSGGTPLTGLTTEYSAGKTTFLWNGTGSLTRLTIFQDSARQDYLFRQSINSFSPPSKDFSHFKKGATSWLVWKDGAKSEPQPIMLTVQEFRKIESKEIEIQRLKETFSGPGHFVFSARALATLAKKAAFTLPNGRVAEVQIAESDLAEGREFSIEHDLPEAGTYIFEVNNTQGSAVVNIPLYVGSAVPLLPDPFALHTAKLDPTPIADLDKARLELLTLINADRKEFDIPAVTLSEDLNEIAQGHSSNMVLSAFFGHTDPQGRGPDERRKNAHYPASIRENLAKASDLNGAQRGLMRSPVHRAAILDDEMTRVGIGIAKNAEGYLFVTQNFSPDPIFESSIPTIRGELLVAAQARRSTEGKNDIREDTALTSIARDWSERMKQNDFFSTTDPNSGDTLIGIIRSRGIRSSLQAHIVKASQKKQLAEELLSQGGLANSENKKIGIGIAVNEIGELFLTTIYTP